MNKFIIEDGIVEGVTGEENIKCDFFTFESQNYQLLVTKEKEYYNVYIINEGFKIDPDNCLNQQIPINSKLTDLDLKLTVIEFHLWKNYNKSFSIEYEEI